jgi:hypothetical protein
MLVTAGAIQKRPVLPVGEVVVGLDRRRRAEREEAIEATAAS